MEIVVISCLANILHITYIKLTILLFSFVVLASVMSVLVEYNSRYFTFHILFDNLHYYLISRINEHLFENLCNLSSSLSVDGVAIESRARVIRTRRSSHRMVRDVRM